MLWYIAFNKGKHQQWVALILYSNLLSESLDFLLPFLKQSTVCVCVVDKTNIKFIDIWDIISRSSFSILKVMKFCTARGRTANNNIWLLLCAQISCKNNNNFRCFHYSKELLFCGIALILFEIFSVNTECFFL